MRAAKPPVFLGILVDMLLASVPLQAPPLRGVPPQAPPVVPAAPAAPPGYPPPPAGFAWAPGVPDAAGRVHPWGLRYVGPVPPAAPPRCPDGKCPRRP